MAFSLDFLKFNFAFVFNGQKLDLFFSLIILEVTPGSINIVKGGVVKAELHAYMNCVTHVVYYTKLNGCMLIPAEDRQDAQSASNAP